MKVPLQTAQTTKQQIQEVPITTSTTPSIPGSKQARLKNNGGKLGANEEKEKIQSQLRRMSISLLSDDVARIAKNAEKAKEAVVKKHHDKKNSTSSDLPPADMRLVRRAIKNLKIQAKAKQRRLISEKLWDINKGSKNRVILPHN